MEFVNIKDTEDENYNIFWKFYDSCLNKLEKKPKETMGKIVNDDSTFEIVLAKKNGEFVGFVTYFKASDEILVENFGIGEGFRGKGFGKEMIKSFLEIKKKVIIISPDPSVLWFFQVNSKKALARRISFLEKSGFKQCGVQKGNFKKKSMKIVILSYPEKRDVQNLVEIGKGVKNYIANE